MINFEQELAITINQAAQIIPGRPNPATVWRWINTGVRGLRLEAVPCGGRWFTSKEAVERFLNAMASRAGQRVSKTESAARKARIKRAEQKLAAAGI